MSLSNAIEILSKDATDPKREMMWRYGVQHALTIIKGHTSEEPDWRALFDEAVGIIDSVNACHGCLRLGSKDQLARVEEFYEVLDATA